MKASELRPVIRQLTSEDVKSAMESRRGCSPLEISPEILREADCWEVVMLLPKDFNQRLSYLGDVLVQATCRHPQNDELRSVVGKLCQALSYMLNSSSWRDGQLHDFDLDELNRKLQRFGVSDAGQ